MINDSIGCFGCLYYDTKTVTDLKALPQHIYDKFKYNLNLLVVEWNIIAAFSRFRFIAWSRSKSAEFDLHFLLCVLQFIRGMYPWMKDASNNVGLDNGSEFCAGS
jgi:hypothetical protein